MNKGKLSTFLTVILSMVVGATITYGIIYYLYPSASGENTVINRTEKKVTITDDGIADAVEKLYDSVVVVGVYKNDEIVSSGTGFVYKKANGKAYILTNNHVISMYDKNKEVRIMFTNKEEVVAKVEGTDDYSDLAVLSLNDKNIESIAEIGSSDEMRIGDTVFTLGAPLDTEFYWSVTRGVLSGKDRMVEVSLSDTDNKDVVMKVLQTDASINSGNSGGPLANANGEVIGITNMKLVSEGVEGIGFAIPIEDAITFAEMIIKGETVQRPLLGAQMLNLTERYYLYREGITLNTELKEGVVLVKIQSGSPADKAGLKRGDIITKFGDYKVRSVASLRYALYKHSVGDEVEVTFERNGKKESLKLKLSAASE